METHNADVTHMMTPNDDDNAGFSDSDRENPKQNMAMNRRV